MGKLIATTQATIDGVDPVGEWVQPDGDHGTYSFDRQARSAGLVLGRTTYEGLAAYWPHETGLTSIRWSGGRGNVHVLGDNGTVWLRLADVQRFDSGVVLLTYRPA